MSYSSVVLVEEEQAVSPEDLSYSEQPYLSQGAAGFGYPSLITGDISSDGELLLLVETYSQSTGKLQCLDLTFS